MTIFSLRSHFDNHGVIKEDIGYMDENLNIVQRLSDIVSFTVFQIMTVSLISDEKAKKMSQKQRYTLDGIEDCNGGFKTVSVNLY